VHSEIEIVWVVKSNEVCERVGEREVDVKVMNVTEVKRTTLTTKVKSISYWFASESEEREVCK